ncbi:MAG: DUF4124 domain-containing protein [Desulfuromonadaceae bacterium]
MNRTILLLLLVLCCSAVADAVTYNWTDDQGVVNFTDNPDRIPAKYRSKALKNVKDITVPGPTRQEEEKVLNDELTAPRSVTAPDSGLPPAPKDSGPPPTLPDIQQSAPAPAPAQAPLGDPPMPAPLGDPPAPAPLGDPPVPAL